MKICAINWPSEINDLLVRVDLVLEKSLGEIIEEDAAAAAHQKNYEARRLLLLRLLLLHILQFLCIILGDLFS